MIRIAFYIDHYLLKSTALMSEVQRVCEEAMTYEFAAVCVPPIFVANTGEWLEGHPVKLATVVGFPFGYSAPKAKLAEVQQAIRDGAEELDIVINLAALKNKSYNYLTAEMLPLVDFIHEQQATVKVIIE